MSVVALLRSCQIRSEQSDRVTTPLLIHLNQGNAVWTDCCF